MGLRVKEREEVTDTETERERIEGVEGLFKREFSFRETEGHYCRCELNC